MSPTVSARRVGVVLALATGLVAVSAAHAAARAASATLTATPGVVVYTDTNAAETFTGCGYQPSTPTTIVVTTPSAISFFGGPSDSSGCIDIVHNGFISLPGTYYVQAWQDNARTGKSVLMAKTSFQVQDAS